MLSALHIIDLAAFRDLEERVAERHPGEQHLYKIKAADQFKPNLIIDTGIAYSDDMLIELRIGQALIRAVGPATRCSQVRLDTQNGCFFPEQEPIATLNTYRFVKNLGTVFGNYFNIDVLEGETLYNKILPED